MAIFYKEDKKKFFKFLEDSKNQTIIEFNIECDFFGDIRKEFEDKFLVKNEFLLLSEEVEKTRFFEEPSGVNYFNVIIEKMKEHDYYDNKKSFIKEHLINNNNIIISGKSIYNYDTYFKYFKHLIKKNKKGYKEILFKTKSNGSDWYIHYNIPFVFIEVNTNKEIIIKNIKDIKVKYDSDSGVYEVYNKKDLIYKNNFNNLFYGYESDNNKTNERFEKKIDVMKYNFFSEWQKERILENIIELIKKEEKTIDIFKVIKKELKKRIENQGFWIGSR